MSTPLPTDDHDTGLHLLRVVESTLSHALGTASAPDRYPVDIVFSRRVSAQEQALIEQPDVRERVAAAGYPDVRLTVSDRRLHVVGAALGVLEAGLAQQLTAVLRSVEEQIRSERADRDDAVEESRLAEEQRVAAVRSEVDRVHFG